MNVIMDNYNDVFIYITLVVIVAIRIFRSVDNLSVPYELYTSCRCINLYLINLLFTSSKMIVISRLRLCDDVWNFTLLFIYATILRFFTHTHTFFPGSLTR